MLTVDKLIKTMAYEEKRNKEIQENNERMIFKLPIFNGITNEEDWNKKKKEIREQRELEIKTITKRVEIKNNNEIKNKKIQKKVLEHRKLLEEQHEKRVRYIQLRKQHNNENKTQS